MFIIFNNYFVSFISQIKYFKKFDYENKYFNMFPIKHKLIPFNPKFRYTLLFIFF